MFKQVKLSNLRLCTAVLVKVPVFWVVTPCKFV